MPQKIDVHGLFIDPETIIDLQLQKRISVSYPVFHETQTSKSFFGRFSSPQKHVLQFDHHQPYGIILADAEQPNPANYIVTYREAIFDRILKGIGQTGKSIAGHLTELLKIEISGDRQYRILQSGRNVKQISIREIPAKVKLLSGQWVDVFKSSPEYDFQGGTPYAVTDVGSSALMICTKEQVYVLYGAGVDAADEDVATAYQTLIGMYNQIQEKKDAIVEEKKERPLFLQLPQISIQLPKIEMPQIRLQSPFVFGNNKSKSEQKESLPTDSSEHD